MSETPPNDIPRGVKLFSALWPVVLFGLVSGASIVSTQAQTAGLDRRLVDIEHNGAPITRERLARMEEGQAMMAKQLDRMETKLNDIDTRTRNRNLRGL